MKTENEDSKQVTSGDVSGFINTLTLLLEDERIGEKTRGGLRDAMNDVANSLNGVDPLAPVCAEIWLTRALNVNMQDHHGDRRAQYHPSFDMNSMLVFKDEEEARAMVDSFFQGNDQVRTENLADVLINIRLELDKEPDGARTVSDELGRLIELLFRRSTTYQLALDLYKRRFDIKRLASPEVALRAVMTQCFEMEVKADES